MSAGGSEVPGTYSIRTSSQLPHSRPPHVTVTLSSRVSIDAAVAFRCCVLVSWELVSQPAGDGSERL